MASKTFTTTADTVRTLLVSAPHADVSVRAEADITEAVIEVRGPEDIVRQTTATAAAGFWTLTLPNTPTATFSTSGGTMVVGTNRGMVIQAGKISGSVTFNGDVTFHGGLPDDAQVMQTEPVTVAIRIPRGTQLITRMQSGNLATSGELGSVEHESRSGDARIAHATTINAETASGSVIVRNVETTATVRTRSGNIDVTGGTNVTVESRSGQIYYAATADCRVNATNRSGNINLRRGGHQVNANTRTRSGDVRDA